MDRNIIIIEKKPENIGNYHFCYDFNSSENVVLTDTFDYLFIKSGYLFFDRESGYLLFGKSGLEYLAALDEKIEKIITPRSLVAKHEFRLINESLVLLDELEKTIARGSVIKLETDDKAIFMMSIEPLRGYQKVVDKIVSALNARDLSEAVKTLLKDDVMVEYSAKPLLNIKDDQPLHEVMGEIYTHLLDVMSLNTDGIIEDVDIEFLHDFRVSVRRIRSALSLVKGVYSKEYEKEFKDRFKLLGSLTGLARDMDVYLDTIHVYEEMLPEWLKGGMSELADHFKATRTLEYNRLAAYLNSGEFEKLCKDWKKVVTGKKYVADKGRKPVLEVAKKAIWQAYKDIEKQAVVMDEHTHSDAVHEIRISFKKIRYLLEFYSSLFDKKKISPMLKDMKTLQDSLGDHNDYHVQQLMLEELVASGKWSSQTSSACGFLAAKLAEKQRIEKDKALGLIISFLEYKPLFTELFK